MPKPGLDPSWRSVIEWGLLNDIGFGTDLVFTYGPLGFLHTRQYHPELFAYQLTYWCAVALALGVFFARYWAETPLWASLLFSSGLFLAAAVPSDAWLLFLPLAAAVEIFELRRWQHRWLVWLLLFLSVLTGLNKFTGFVAAAATFLTVDIARTVQRRIVPVYTLAWALGSWLVFLTVTGDWNWPAYVAGGLEVALGYSGAMQIMGPHQDIWLAILITLGSVGLLTWGYVGRGAGRHTAATLTIGLSAALFAYLSFKAGVVRHDGPHILLTGSGLLLLAVLAALTNFSQNNNTTAKIAAVGVAALASWNLLSLPERHWRQGRKPDEMAWYWVVQSPKSKLAQVSNLLLHNGYDSLPAKRNAALASIRQRYPMPLLKGSVDIYPWDQALVLAHSLDYRPRPIFQSYSAYTPSLIERNYRHLIAVDGPDYTLFAPKSIDGQLVALMDGKSWKALLTKYDAISMLHQHLLLKRRTGSERVVVDGEPRETTLTWDERLQIPQLGPCTWAEVEIEPSRKGRLVPLVYQSPVIDIELEMTHGKHRRRFVPGMGKTGFLLNPIVETAANFADVCSPKSVGLAPRVGGISFHTSSLGRFVFKPTIRVRLASLSIAGMPEPVAPELAQELNWIHVGSELIRKGHGRCLYKPRWQDGRVFAHAQCELPLRIDDGTSLDIAFGIFETAWKQGQTNGVGFEVRAQLGNRWQVLASQELRPRQRAGDRSGGRFRIDVPPGTTKLLLVTEPLQDARWDWSYWGPISEVTPGGAPAWSGGIQKPETR